MTAITFTAKAKRSNLATSGIVRRGDDATHEERLKRALADAYALVQEDGDNLGPVFIWRAATADGQPARVLMYLPGHEPRTQRDVTFIRRTLATDIRA